MVHRVLRDDRQIRSQHATFRLLLILWLMYCIISPPAPPLVPHTPPVPPPGPLPDLSFVLQVAATGVGSTMSLLGGLIANGAIGRHPGDVLAMCGVEASLEYLGTALHLFPAFVRVSTRRER